MPYNCDLLISIVNLIVVMDPLYTLDHLLTRSNIFAKLSGCDTHEVSVLFKTITMRCDITEYLNQGYLDDFLGSIVKPDSYETRKNYLCAMKKLDYQSLCKINNWREFIGNDEHSLTILGNLSAEDHPVDISQFVPSLIEIVNNDHSDIQKTLAIWTLINVMD